MVTVALTLLATSCGSGSSDNSDPSASGGSGTSPSDTGGATGAGGNGASGGGGSSSGAASASGGATGSGGGAPGPVGPELALPIEVLGSGAPDDAAIASRDLLLAATDTSAVASLFVTCHRCGFYDAPEFQALARPLTKVKASLRIDGDASKKWDSAKWIDVTDGTVTVDAVAAAHGGINGGLVTLSFHLAIDAATRERLLGGGRNRVDFRFNGTDGNSNGYRVLAVEFQDASGKSLSPMAARWADIGSEKTAPAAAADVVAKGQALWSGRNTLVKSPIVPVQIRAACTDCHATHGRDLQYFNYSNASIVQRSRFHGLTEDQGKSIAVYLRATNAAVPHVPAASPWNPPYQPGRGLDDRPAVEWAAGAGIDAVLPDGKAFLKAFLGKPIDGTALDVSQADLDQEMSLTALLNTREIAVPLQLPDWNAWLPPTSPLDIWTPDAGQQQGLFETGKSGNFPLKVIADVRTWLDAHLNPNGVYGDWTHLTPGERDQLQGMLGNIGGQTLGFGGGGRGSRVSGDAANPFAVEIGGKKLQALANGDTKALADLSACGPVGDCTPFGVESFIERADVGLYHWMAVKQWEMVHTYGLEEPALHGHQDNGKWVPEGEKRGWPYSWPSVFYVAPHMIYAPEKTAKGTREFYLSWEKRLVSYYRTNQWYQLQMTVNPGWAGASNGPMDWPYHQGFTTAVVDDLVTAKAPAWIQAAHDLRFQEIVTKVAQLANTDLPFDAPDKNAPDELFKNQGIQSKADLLFKIAPTNLLDSGPADYERSRFHALDEIAPGLYVKVLNSAIGLYNQMYASTDPARYRRCDPNNLTMGAPENHAGQRFCADQGRTPLQKNDQGQPHLPGGSFEWTTDQNITWGILQSTTAGADAARIKTWSDWANRMWPQ
jgi:hypothetical protein